MVLLDQSTYQQKMENILKDNSKFKLATNNSLKQLQKFQNFLARFKKSAPINQEYIAESNQQQLQFQLFTAYLKLTKTIFHFDQSYLPQVVITVSALLGFQKFLPLSIIILPHLKIHLIFWTKSKSNSR